MHDLVMRDAHRVRSHSAAPIWLVRLLGIVGGVILALLLPRGVAAEGSRELTANGGARPHLEYIVTLAATPPVTNTAEFEIAGIQRQTIIYVYAQNGETINLASSVMDATFLVNNRTARIVAVPPNAASSPITFLPGNTTVGSSGAAGCGHIAARVNEVAGPDLTGTGSGPPNSYNACQIPVTAATAGVWEIHFVSPRADRSNQNNPPGAPSAANVNWAAQTTDNTYVAAWDVTVANGATAIPGRAYTRSLFVTTGANGPTAGVMSKLFVKAYDGALYNVDLNNIDGFTSVFFSDTRGPITTANGKPIYRSLQLEDTPPPNTFLRVFGALPDGFGIKNPFSNDTPSTNSITHKLFFNTPDSNLPASAPVGKLKNGTPLVGTTDLNLLGSRNPPGASTATPIVSTEWLNNPYVAPQPPQNLDFVGIEGTLGQAGVGLGGFIRFDNTNPPTQATSYRIELNFGNGFATRYLIGSLTAGQNSVFWDGRDGNGVVVTNPAANFTVKVTLNNGEIHFPVIDAELHTGGYKILRQNPSTPTPVDTIYWDDRYFYTGNAPYDYSICANGETPIPSFPGGAGTFATPLKCYGTNPNRNGLAGVASTGGAHKWFDNAGTNANGQLNGFGNKRIINTWTFIPSPPAVTTGSISVLQTDLQLSKTDTTPYPSVGSPYTYTVIVTNSSNLTIMGAKLIDQVPASIVPINWTCTIVPGNSCSPASGTTTGITALLNMQANAVATLIITGTAPAIKPCNTATVIRPPDVTDTDTSNNTASTGNPAGTIGLAMRVVEAAPRPSPNTYRVTMEYVVQAGNQNLTNVQVSHNLQTWFNSQTPNASSISIISLSSNDFTVSGFYNGTTNTNLLAPGNNLAAGATGVIRLTFEVVFPSAPGNVTYTSNATATGTRPDNTPATDQSTDGAIPDPSGDCDPTNDNDATPINFSTDATSISLLSFTGSSGGGLGGAVSFRIAVIAVLVLLLNILLTLMLRRVAQQWNA